MRLPGRGVRSLHGVRHPHPGPSGYCMTFTRVISMLEGRYGRPKPPKVTRPFEMILHENAAYLVDDERRDRVWASLKKLVGARPTPEAILDADRDDLIIAIRDGGMRPPMRADKLRRAGRIAIDFFDGDLDSSLKAQPKRARAALK